MGVKVPNQFFLRPLPPAMTRSPFAVTEIVKDRWQRYQAGENVHYSQHLGALILRPDPALRDMALSAHTVYPASNAWETCTPANTGAVHLLTLLANGDATDVTSNYSLPERPCLMISLVRADAPTGTERSQRFKFSFGQIASGYKYRLEFGGDSTPRVLEEGVEISRAPEQSGDRGEYLDAERLRIEILNLAGKLYIIGLTREPWVVYGVDVPAGTWQWQCTAGAYGLNVTLTRFATSGHVTTPLIEHWKAFEAEAMRPQLYPPAPAGTTAAVSIASSSGTQRAYRLDMTGNGYTTPIVQLWGGHYPAQIAARSGDWIEFTPWVESADESKTLELTASTCAITVNLQAQHEGQTFLQAVGGLPAGQYQVYYTVGVTGGTALQRMAGIAKISEPVHEQQQTLTITVVDRWAQLQDVKMLWAPSFAGMSLQEAVRTACNLAGYADDEVICDGLAGTLDAPPTGSDSPLWLPANGTSVAEWLETIGRVKRVLFAHDEYGRLRAAHQWPSGGISAAYSTAPGTAASVTLSRVELRRDLTGAVNQVVVEGRDADGGPLYAAVFDADSITDPTASRYIGYPATQYIREDNAATQEATNEAALQAWAQRPGGKDRVVITSDHPQSNLCERWPYHEIPVTDAVTGATGTYKVISTRGRLEKYRNVYTLECEEIEP